jgi:hypothetical protein
VSGSDYWEEIEMAKHPAEVFGYPIWVNTTEAQTARDRHHCPFANKTCDKKTRLIDYSMGVCSVQYGENIIALSPNRFLQDNIVFYDIADHHFNDRNNLLVFSEVGLRRTGNFDFVMVRHRPLSSEIEDFVVIEFQTGQTTSTGRLVDALRDFMGGNNVEGETYNFGLNMADIWKRSFTQILNKGIVLENWGHKIYWVVQEPIYQNLIDRYNLHGMRYLEDHSTRFAIYDLRREDNKYELFQTRIESSTIDDLFYAFRNNPKIPSKDDFIRKLKGKIQRNAHLQLDLR